MKVNMHGIKIKGLRKASGHTENYTDRNMYDELFFDRSTGDVWAVFHCSIGHNWWTEYHDPDIIKIGSTVRHLTMQEIADMVYDAMASA